MGKPAEFTSILNAAALYRAKVLYEGDNYGAGELVRLTDIVERLTVKALEATYIQREYRLWRGEE